MHAPNEHVKLGDISQAIRLDFRKPGNRPAVRTCTDTNVPPGWTATVETIITPAGRS